MSLTTLFDAGKYNQYRGTSLTRATQTATTLIRPAVCYAHSHSTTPTGATPAATMYNMQTKSAKKRYAIALQLTLII